MSFLLVNPILSQPVQGNVSEENVIVRLGRAEKSISKFQLFSLSSTFKLKLESGFAEQANNLLELEAPDGIAHETCVDFLDYLSGKVLLLNDNAPWVILLARYLELTFLEIACKNVIKTNLTEENVEGYLIFAKEHHFPDLIKTCAQYIGGRLEEDNLIYYLRFADEHQLLTLTAECVNVAAMDDLLNEVTSYALEGNNKNLKLLCFNAIRIALSKDIHFSLPNAQSLVELAKKFSLSSFVRCYFDDEDKRSVEFSLSGKVVDGLWDLNQILGFECIKIPFFIEHDDVNQLASAIPHPHTVLFESRNTPSIPEVWQQNVKKLIATHSYAIETIDCNQAEIIECASCYKIVSVEAPEARKIKMVTCFELKTLNLPKAERLEVQNCKKLERVTIPKDCQVTGLPPNCEIVYESN